MKAQKKTMSNRPINKGIINFDLIDFDRAMRKLSGFIARANFNNVSTAKGAEQFFEQLSLFDKMLYKEAMENVYILKSGIRLGYLDRDGYKFPIEPDVIKCYQTIRLRIRSKKHPLTTSANRQIIDHYLKHEVIPDETREIIIDLYQKFSRFEYVRRLTNILLSFSYRWQSMTLDFARDTKSYMSYRPWIAKTSQRAKLKKLNQEQETNEKTDETITSNHD